MYTSRKKTFNRDCIRLTSAVDSTAIDSTAIKSTEDTNAVVQPR